MSKIVVFGVGKIAEVISYYIEHETDFTIDAYTCDDAFIESDKFFDKPLIPFSKIEKEYKPESYKMFVAIGYQDLNKLREVKCKEAIEKGYELISVISNRANLPENTKYGYNCFVMSPAIIHPFVEIGNNVFIWSGAMIGHHTKIEDNVWVTSSANLGGNTCIGKNTFIAINASIAHNIKIGESCFIGASVLVNSDLQNKALVIKNADSPARLNSDQFLKISKFS